MPKNHEDESDSVIEFESSPEHYKAEACVVWCYDARFSELYDAFLDKRGFSKSKVDLVKGAGGAQALALENGADHDTFRSQIEKSIKLHHTEKVILMVHMDCGGYGGSKAFDNNREKEWDHHIAELEKAASFVYDEFPDVREIECYIADFNGMRRVRDVIRPAEAAKTAAA